MSGGELAHQGHTPSTSGSRPTSKCLQSFEQRKRPKSHGGDGAGSGGARHDACLPGRGPAPDRGAQSISQLEIVTARLSDVDQLDDDSPQDRTRLLPLSRPNDALSPAICGRCFAPGIAVTVRWDEATAKGRAGAATRSSPVQGSAQTQARHEGPSALRRVLQKDSVWGYGNQVDSRFRHGCAG